MMSNAINDVCIKILNLSDQDFEEMQKTINEQKAFISPLRMATTAYKHKLGEYNARVLNKLRDLREALRSGAQIKKPNSK